jgi:glucosamine--fructose-6-phosphate aminotransferase (isomerizing)
MDMRGSFTRQEIYSQPEAWSQALVSLNDQLYSIQSLWEDGKYAQIIFTGCGSTYYLAIASATLFQELTGLPARALPGSELWLYPKSSYPRSGHVLLVAVSRSGETSETLHACRAFNESQRGDLITLSCCPEMPLAKMGVLNLVFPSGAEQSVAQTRAFSTLYLATLGLIALWAGRPDLLAAINQLPKAGQHILDKYNPLAQSLGQRMEFDRFYFLGSGPRYGLACELSLKMKEMSLSHSEPFHFLEFRHGPKSMVTPSTLVIGLASATNYDLESGVLAELNTLGGQVLEIGENGQDVAFESGIPEEIYNILYLPTLQVLAFERSLAKGLNPDRPHNLEAVVRLK